MSWIWAIAWVPCPRHWWQILRSLERSSGFSLHRPLGILVGRYWWQILWKRCLFRVNLYHSEKPHKTRSRGYLAQPVSWSIYWVYWCLYVTSLWGFILAQYLKFHECAFLKYTSSSKFHMKRKMKGYFGRKPIWYNRRCQKYTTLLIVAFAFCKKYSCTCSWTAHCHSYHEVTFL